MLKRIWTLIKIIAGIVVGTVVGITAFFLIGRIVFQNFYQPYVVLSGSMEPVIHTGGVVVTKPQVSYKVNDIVTFKQGREFVTHRLNQITQSGEFITKGDANEDADSGSIQASQIVGKVELSIPYLGYLVEFSKTLQGFVMLVIIPATIIVYEELRSIKSEFAKMFKKFRSGKPLESQVMQNNQPNQAAPKRGIPKLYAIIPILGCALLIIAASAAYFTDREVTQQNTFSAATDFPQAQNQKVLGLEAQSTPGFTPPDIPGLAKHLVINEVYPDADNQSQWLEVYNPTGMAIDLSNYSIRDGANCDEFLGGVSIPGGGYAILSPATLSQFNSIWQTPDQTVFIPITGTIGNGISAGDIFVLSSTSCDSASDNLDQVTIPSSDPGQSYKRAIDGVDTDSDTDWLLTQSPTPGK